MYNEAMLIFANQLMANYEANKGAFLDYDDLLYECINLLSSSENAMWLLHYLDMQYNHILVDEAQDTMTILTQYVQNLEFKGDKVKVENFLRELYSEALSV